MSSSFRNASFSSPNISTLSNSTRSSSHGYRRSDVDPVIMSDGLTHILQHFGAPLPSMVKAVLNKVSNEPRSVSFRLDRNGWAWLVFKRHLYIWRYVVDAKRAPVPCRELLLPSSELFHNARLVTVVSTMSALPACIAVSPEGHIIYWPNISNESTTVTINADLAGQECDSLTSVWPFGCILATTSATVLLVKLVTGTKPSLSCTSLNCGSKGWLGGLSKRMSYLMPLGTPTMETKRTSVAVPLGQESQSNRRSATVYVLAGTHFQVWNLNSEGQHCSWDITMDDIIRKQFHRVVWEEKLDVRRIQIWLLDIRADDDGKKISILAACTNPSDSESDIRFGIFTFDGTSPRIREGIQLKLIDFRCPKEEGDEEFLHSWKLLTTPSFSFMISPDRILIIGCDEECPFDTIHGGRSGLSFVGAGLSVENFPLIFTSTQGLFYLKPSQENSMCETFADVRIPDHLAMSMTQNVLQDLSMSEDHVNRFKSAFLHFCGKRTDECMEILGSLFPPNQPSLTPHDPVDIWTVALCEKLVDDVPVADSRWGSSFGRSDMEGPFALKSKMLIKNFLADKKKGLEIFFSFLRVTGIWQRLSGVLVREDIHCTGSVLYNAYEKIGFAMTLHSLQADGRYRKILDPGIKSVVSIRQESSPQSCLSFNDIFFKDVSRVHQILSALVILEEEILIKRDNQEILEAVTLTTEVILVLFSELQQLVTKEFGQIRHVFLVPLLENPSNFEVSPWYIQSHTLEALIKQTNLILTATQLSENSDERLDLFKQLEQLTDLILDGLKTEAESLRASQRYPQKLSEFEEKRANLLGNLVKLDPSGSLALAEKYLDFNTLVGVTCGEEDMDKLKDFFEKYYDIGFPVFTFEWFLKQKKDKELLQVFSKSKYSALLTEFLKGYPSISWHHSTINDDFYGASRTLSKLAESEESSVDDQKFLFCLSKLALLATGTEDQENDARTYKEINNRLELIQLQNELPDEALRVHGIERQSMRVLTPSQLIDMYTSPLITPDVTNFWKAAALTSFVPELQAEKRLLIVTRAILCDPWAEWGTEHPLDVIVPSVLYRLLVFIVSNGEKPEDYFDLPKLSRIDILKPVFDNENAVYLLKACDECLRQGDIQ